MISMRIFCSGSWPPPRIHFQPFPVCHHDGFTDGKHKKRSTLADYVVLCARKKDVLELELEGSFGEERNESVKSKDRVRVSEWNAIRKRQDAVKK